MPNPSTQITQLRNDLGSLLEFDLNANMAGFIAYRVLPVIDVQYAADTFGRIPTEQLGKIASVVRAADGGYNRIHMTFTKDNYATEEYGLEAPVDQRNARLYADYLDAEMATTLLIRHMLLAAAEVRVAALVFNATTWSGASLTTGVSTEWSNFTSSKPVDNVMAASQKVRDNCGQYANTLIINRKVLRNLQQNAQIFEKIVSSGAGSPAKPGDITNAMIAACMDLEQVIVADSSYDTTNEGIDTSFSDIWDDEYAMVCRTAKTNMIEEPCIGRTFHWTGDESVLNGLVEEYDDEKVRGKVIRSRHDVHEKIIYPEAGHLLSNITA